MGCVTKNRPFRSCLLLLSQNECETISYETVFPLQVQLQTNVQMKRFAQGVVLKQSHKVNSEMAYSHFL